MVSRTWPIFGSVFRLLHLKTTVFRLFCLTRHVRGNKNYGESCTNEGIRFLGDPGATSQDDAIFLGESLLQELKSPWELILTEPVPEWVSQDGEYAERTSKNKRLYV